MRPYSRIGWGARIYGSLRLVLLFLLLLIFL
jgi:hypothetical protein